MNETTSDYLIGFGGIVSGLTFIVIIMTINNNIAMASGVLGFIGGLFFLSGVILVITRRRKSTNIDKVKE